jgi:hypothetical protein
MAFAGAAIFSASSNRATKRSRSSTLEHSSSEQLLSV